MDLTFDDGKLTMKGSTRVIINASMNISGTGTKLPIEIVGEFKDIPPHLHQMYMESMLSSYGDVNVYNNTDDKEPMTIEEQKREWRLTRLAKLLVKSVSK